MCATERYCIVLWTNNSECCVLMLLCNVQTVRGTFVSSAISIAINFDVLFVNKHSLNCLIAEQMP